MKEAANATMLLVALLASSFLGLLVRPMLQERLRNPKTAALLHLSITTLVTIAAIVLGLLTSATKTSFDAVNRDLGTLSSELIRLDDQLRDLGPAAGAPRLLLRRYLAQAITSSWPDEAPPPDDMFPKEAAIPPGDAAMQGTQLGALLDQARRVISAVPTPSDTERGRVAGCLITLETVTHQRWQLISEATPVVSIPFFLMLGLWLVIVFASLGLSAPRNLLVVVTLALGAVVIAAAIFVILDLDTPFTGMLVVSSEPLRAALAHMRR